jgi:hypothetical protein
MWTSRTSTAVERSATKKGRSSSASSGLGAVTSHQIVWPPKRHEATVGMALFFAPVANVVLSSVRPEEEGQASGANNAIRELGGVFGVAALAAVFTANGGYHSGQRFVDGMNPAVMIGAALVALGAIAAFAIKRNPRSGPVETATEAPLLAACACASCWCARPGDCAGTNDEGSSREQELPAQAPILVGA